MDTESAAIQERPITIRVLTVGTKQITQALFRQLVEEDVIDDETGKLRGTVWGWVNLHIGCESKEAHRHVVWEDDGQLKHSKAFATYTQSDYYHHLARKLTDLSTLYVCLVALAGRHFNNYKQGSSQLTLTVKGFRVLARVSDNVRLLWDFSARAQEKELPDWGEPFSLRGIERIKGKGLRGCFLQGDYGDYAPDYDRYEYLNPSQYTSHEQAYADVERAAEELKALMKQWEESYRAIEQRGQLFIAVSGVWK